MLFRCYYGRMNGCDIFGSSTFLFTLFVNVFYIDNNVELTRKSFKVPIGKPFIKAFFLINKTFIES